MSSKAENTPKKKTVRKAAPAKATPKATAKAAVTAKSETTAKPKTTARPKSAAKIKTPAKTTSGLKTAAKTIARIKTASSAKPETVASLAESVELLEARLKSADTINHMAIKSLRAVVEKIKTSAQKSTGTQKAALTRGLNRLEAHMESSLQRSASQTKAGIKSELAAVTASGANLLTLEAAVSSAHKRLDAADALQRESLARMNRHIADLATSVDGRLSSESEARKADSAELNAKIDFVRENVENRVDQVETETANALEAVGAKVAEFAAALEKRAKSSDTDTAERLADLAQETQSEFTSAKTDITTRLEALEIIASAWSPDVAKDETLTNPYLPANTDDPRIDQMDETIRSLQDELARMHARIATVQNDGQPSGTPAPLQIAPTTSPTAPTNILQMPGKLGDTQDNPYAAAAQAIGASAAEAIPEPVTKAPAPIPPAAKASDPLERSNESHVPEEFDPTAFLPKPDPVLPIPPAPFEPPQMTPHPAAALPGTVPITPPGMAPPPPLAPPIPGAYAQAPVSPGMPGGEPLMSAPQPVSTYADPAYAEGSEMRAERIGTEPVKKRPGLPKLPVSGNNLKVGALAVGVAVVGLFAAKTIFGGPSSGDITIASNEAESTAPQGGFDPFNTGSDAAGSPPPPSAPVGQYAETRTPQVVAGQENSLDAAVTAGNPIAQFQKGLVQLQAGQTREGARLIRLSANRNQPAAQYRLAKLYETGTGVAQDAVTARELIERAARGGNRIAMHDLGNYYAYGQGGLTANMTDALSWFTKAAERGVVDSQFNVAFLSEGNEGVPRDLETALFWYFVAARQGDQGAPERIEALSAELDAATRADIKARADQFRPKPVDEAANGIFRNVPWSKPSSPAIQANSGKAKSAQIVKIRDAQTLLTELGYQVGTADGIAGAKTRDAIKSFEAVNGMPQTGQVTEDLLQRLETASGA